VDITRKFCRDFTPNTMNFVDDWVFSHAKVLAIRLACKAPEVQSRGYDKYAPRRE
jgi:hypothetical protein